MNTAETYPSSETGEHLTSPEEFETLQRAYQVKNEQYLPAVCKLVEEGRLDRMVLTRLERVERAHIRIAAAGRDETGERFASADVATGELTVPNEHFVSHEATHLLGGVAWQPLNEGLTQLLADKISNEMDAEAPAWLYEEEKRLAYNIVRLAGFDLTPDSDMEDVNWARLSRIFCGDNPEENFNELNVLVRRKTGVDILAEMRNLQGRGDYLERAAQKADENPGTRNWVEQSVSERLLLEAREMNAVLEAPMRRLQQKTSRPLGRAAGMAAGKHRQDRRKPRKITRLFSRLAS